MEDRGRGAVREVTIGLEAERARRRLDRRDGFQDGFQRLPARGAGRGRAGDGRGGSLLAPPLGTGAVRRRQFRPVARIDRVLTGREDVNVVAASSRGVRGGGGQQQDGRHTQAGHGPADSSQREHQEPERANLVSRLYTVGILRTTVFLQLVTASCHPSETPSRPG